MEVSSEWTEERKEDDFEDFELERSGGEPGIWVRDEPASEWKVIASSQVEDAGENNGLS